MQATHAFSARAASPITRPITRPKLGRPPAILVSSRPPLPMLVARQPRAWKGSLALGVCAIIAVAVLMIRAPHPSSPPPVRSIAGPVVMPPPPLQGKSGLLGHLATLEPQKNTIVSQSSGASGAPRPASLATPVPAPADTAIDNSDRKRLLSILSKD